MLVHLEIDVEDIPSPYQLLAVDLSDDIPAEIVTLESLQADWRTNEDATRALGDRWLDRQGTALLRVPSAIVPFAFNWLLNPRHADAAKATIAQVIRVAFDLRLIG